MAKEVKLLKMDLEVLDRAGSYARVVCAAVVVVYNDGCCVFVWLVGWSVAPTTDGEPPGQGLHEDCEDEG